MAVTPPVLLPDSRLRTAWDFLIFLATLSLAIVGPLKLVYPLRGPVFTVYSGVALTSVFFVDMVLGFRTAYFMRGELIKDPAQIRRHYLRSWFVIDLLSLLPLDLLSGPVPIAIAGHSIDIAPPLRLVRLVRLMHLKELVNRWRHADCVNPSIIRLGILLLWMLMLVHWSACGWILVGNIRPDYSAAENYLRSFYWAVTTFATIGYGDITPLNIQQIAYTVVVEMVGVGMFSYMIGNVASLLANLDIARSKYQEKINRLNLFLEYRDIPIALRQKLRHYYRYMWESRRGYDENLILKDLPSALQKELAMHIHADVIEKVPIFKGASDAFIKEIVMKLVPAMFTPGDFVFREGEIGHNMYFISRGSVEVLSERSGKVYATIGEGGYFGEIALLMAQPRNASVRALEYCDLYTLDKASFQLVLREFPQFAAQVKKMARERMHAPKQKSQPRGRSKNVSRKI